MSSHHITDKFSPQKINAHHIESELDTPDLIYIDLAIIRDIQFGCLFTFIQEHPPEEASALYTYLLSRWHARQKSHFDTIVEFFPKLKITQEMFDQRLHDPEWSDRIFSASPLTVYPHVLRAQLTINVNHSQVAEKFTKIKISQHQYIKNYDQVVYCINTWPLTLDQKNRDLTAAFFRDNFLVDVVIINQDPHAFSKEIFLLADHFHIRDVKAFVESPEIQELWSTSIYIKKKVFGAPFFHIKKHSDFPDKRMTAELQYLQARLNLSVTFSWIPNNVCCILPDLFKPKEKKE